MQGHKLGVVGTQSWNNALCANFISFIKYKKNRRPAVFVVKSGFHRGNVHFDNLQVMNAILYVAEYGCKWRGLPEHFGCWHSIYTRMNRWSKNGVLERIFERLQKEQLIRIKPEAVSLDSTIVMVAATAECALNSVFLQATPETLLRAVNCSSSWGQRLTSVACSWIVPILLPPQMGQVKPSGQRKKGISALRLGSVKPVKIRITHPFLKLNRIARHCQLLCFKKNSKLCRL